MKARNSKLNPLKMRHSLGLVQGDFWSKVGVTQSGGSRYESGRNIPRPVRELLRLVYVEGIDIKRIHREHFEVAQHLKKTKPALYDRLLKEARKQVR